MVGEMTMTTAYLTLTVPADMDVWDVYALAEIFGKPVLRFGRWQFSDDIENMGSEREVERYIEENHLKDVEAVFGAAFADMVRSEIRFTLDTEFDVEAVRYTRFGLREAA